MALLTVTLAVDITARFTPTGKLSKRERERIAEGIADCLGRAPADLDVWHAEVLDIEVGVS